MNFEVFSTINFDRQLTYKDWKRQREDLISKIGPKLMEMSENELITTYKNWSNGISQIIDSPKLKNQLCMLLAFSVLSHFQADIDQIKIFSSFVNSLLASKNPLVYHLAIKTLYWISVGIADGNQFLVDALRDSFFWISNDPKYAHNALIIINCSKKFPTTEFFSMIHRRALQFFEFGCSVDTEISAYAIKIITFFLRHNNLNIEKSIDSEFFPLAMQNINSLSFHRAKCSLVIIKTCFWINQLHFVTSKILDPLISVLVSLSQSTNDQLFIEAVSFSIEIIKMYPSLYDSEKEDLFELLIQKCQKSTKLEIFDVLNLYIRVFRPNNKVEQINELVKQIIRDNNGNRNMISLAFSVLASLLENISDSRYDPDILCNQYPCHNYLKCLKARSYLSIPLRKHLSSYVAKGLNPKSQTPSVLLALSLVQILPHSFFDHPSRLYEALYPLTESTDYSIRIEVLKTLSILKIPEACAILLNFSLFDKSKEVRFAAVSLLSPTPELSMFTNSVQVLNDSSFKVRRVGLELVSSLLTFNPLHFSATIAQYIDFVISAVNSVSDVKLSVKYASLLPIIAKHFKDSMQQIAPSLLQLCLNSLCSKKSEDYRIISKDSFIDPHSYLMDSITLRNSEPNRYKLFVVNNQQLLEKRKEFFLQTLANLGNLVTPYIESVLEAFYMVITTKSSKSLMSAAAVSLANLSNSIETGLNLRVLYPSFIPALMKILSGGHGKEVSIKVMRLLGSACDGGTLSHNEEVEAISSEPGTDLQNPSFYTDFVMSKLIPYLETPNLQLFESITMIFYSSPDDAAKFINKVIPAFISYIDSGNVDHRDVLFHNLCIIFMKCKTESMQFLSELTQLALRHINHPKCISLCSALSYSFLGSLIPYISQLYHKIVGLIEIFSHDSEELLRFASLAIIYQNQPFEVYINSLEKKLSNKSIISQQFIHQVINSLTFLIQSTDLIIYQSRIALLIHNILQILENKHEIENIIYTAIIYLKTPPKIIELWISKYNITLSNLGTIKSDIMNGKSLNFYHYSFIIKKQIKVNDLFISIIPFNDSQEFFSKFGEPEGNVLSWINELSDYVIPNSPSAVIRSCTSLVNSISSLKNQIFPVAFLSCWKIASLSEREYFSSVLTKIITQYPHVDSFVSQIAELLDRASIPLLIDDDIIAKECESRPLQLYFRQRLFRSNPNNRRAVENLMRLNTEMGRNASARGLLVDAKDSLDLESAGKWREILGEWDKALEIYKNTNPDNPNMIACYAHLEEWEDLKKNESMFEKMDLSEKAKYARYFSLAFYQSQDYEKTKYYLSFINNNMSLSEIFISSLFFLRTEQTKQAEETIYRGFLSLVQDKAAYSSGDAYRVHQNLNYAQVFVELEEALKIKFILNDKDKDIQELASQTWGKRLKGFKRDSDTWIKLIQVRSLLFDPDQYVDVYLKMISVLRKERRWKLIDSYFNKFFSKNLSPIVDFAQAKILWARGNHNESIEYFRFLISLNEFREHKSELFWDKVPSKKLGLILNSFSDLGEIPTDVYDLLNSIDISKPDLQVYEEQRKVIKLILNKYPRTMYHEALHSFEVNLLTDRINSSIYRVYANYLSTITESGESSIIEILNLYEKAKNLNEVDHRTWLGWAYANARLIDMCPNMKDQYSLNAVSGFLKATQLWNRGSLEYLCQMFSIFFQVTESSSISVQLEKISKELISLSPSIIIQIIPQITVQIAHKDPAIRSVVHQILYKFGKDHFQALFFPLKVYENSQDHRKATISKEILHSLGKNHISVMKDAELFADGMLRAAISWYEEWITALDTSSRASHEGKTEIMDKVLRNQFNKFDHPQCDLDKWFISNHGDIIRQCRDLFGRHTTQSLKTMWDLFRGLFNQLQEKVKKLEIILLPKISEELAKKKNFSIVIPGTYSIDHSSPLIDYVESALHVLGTQQHPRCVYLRSSIGDRVKFLLKGNEDLRLDQRIMQFFDLINSLLKKGGSSKELGASIVKYAIVPLSTASGLISWVTGADTFHQMINEQRNIQKISQSAEYEVLDSNIVRGFPFLNKIQMLEQFYEVSSKCHANEIRDLLWSKSPNASVWLYRSRNFTISTAIMSMVGYVIGLGDRHPSNIMIQRETGKVIHIDFGDSFESAINRTNYPEKVPFRLTRMIVNALDNSSVEGMFRRACEDSMWVLRENMSSLVAQLEIFVHEPLYEGDKTTVVSRPSDIIERVAHKLKGKDTLFTDPLDEEILEKDVEAQVDSLIRVSSDESRYVSHYPGWCPFW